MALNGSAAEALLDACEERVPGLCPSRYAAVVWEDWWIVFIGWPMASQLALTLFVGTIMSTKHSLGSFLRRVVVMIKAEKGFLGLATNEPRWLVAASILEMLGSMTSICIWVLHVYWQETMWATRTILLSLAFVDLIHWVYGRLETELSVKGLWKLDGVADVFTVVPTLVMLNARGLSSGWEYLSLHFLRPLAILGTMARLQRQERHDHLIAINLMARLLCFIIVSAGMVLMLETLGDPEPLVQNHIETPGGDKISFLQMVQFILVTLTTVGYGDFSPRTLAGRIFTTVFIWVGLFYTWFIHLQVIDSWAAAEGSGSYDDDVREGIKSKHHVVVVLCVKGPARQFSSMISGFLHEILHSTQSHQWPDVIFLSPTIWAGSHKATQEAPAFKEFLKVQGFSEAVQKHVWFLVGEKTSQADLERAGVGSSSLTFLLADMNSEKPDQDDAANIFTALVVLKHFPNVPLRLMLLRPQSKELAVQSGIEMGRCFSLRELKANILAQNMRCHGLLPMICCMLKSVDPYEKEMALTMNYKRNSSMSTMSSMAETFSPKLLPTASVWQRDDPDEHEPDWLQLYMEGLQRSLFGFELAARFADLTFGELVEAVYDEVGAIVVALYIDGQVKICPQRTHRTPCVAGQICFAIASDCRTLNACRQRLHDPDHWREGMHLTEEQQQRRARREGPHVASAQLMGDLLKSSLINEGDLTDSEDEDDMIACDSLLSEKSEQYEKDYDYRPMSARSLSSQATGCGRRMRGLVESAAGGRRSSKMSAFGGRLASKLRRHNGLDDPDGGDEVGHVDSLSQLQKLKNLRMMARAAHKELYVLIVCNGEVWQQVRTFVGALTPRYLPVFPHIVIVAPSDPPPRLFEGCDEHLTVLQGECTKTRRLIEAGILEADGVVVMAGEVPRIEHLPTPLFRDAQVVLCAAQLECWCGLADDEVFTTYELQESSSVWHLPRLMQKKALSLQKYVDRVGKANYRAKKGRRDDDNFSDDEGLMFESIFDNNRRERKDSFIQSSWNALGFLNRQIFQRDSVEDSLATGSRRVSMASSFASDYRGERSRRGSRLSMASIRSTESPGESWAPELSERSSPSQRLKHSPSGISLPGDLKRRRTLCDSKGRPLNANGPGRPIIRGSRSTYVHPRFAAGQVFSPEIWGSMLGRMYHMPAIIELVEALVIPHRRGQSAFPWQIKVPPAFVGQPFGDLVASFALNALGIPGKRGYRTQLNRNTGASDSPDNRASLASRLSDFNGNRASVASRLSEAPARASVASGLPSLPACASPVSGLPESPARASIASRRSEDDGSDQLESIERSTSGEDGRTEFAKTASDRSSVAEDNSPTAATRVSAVKVISEKSGEKSVLFRKDSFASEEGMFERQPKEGPVVAIAIYRRRLGMELGGGTRTSAKTSASWTSLTRESSVRKRAFESKLSNDANESRMSSMNSDEETCSSNADDFEQNDDSDGEEAVAQGTGWQNYIILAPSSDVRLREDDWIVVLGSKSFGRKASQQGLLRGPQAARVSERASDRQSERTNGESLHQPSLGGSRPGAPLTLSQLRSSVAPNANSPSPPEALHLPAFPSSSGLRSAADAGMPGAEAATEMAAADAPIRGRMRDIPGLGISDLQTQAIPPGAILSPGESPGGIRRESPSLGKSSER